MLGNGLRILTDIELCDGYGDAALAAASGAITDLRGSFSSRHSNPSYLPSYSLSLGFRSCQARLDVFWTARISSADHSSVQEMKRL
jgi:hypothetical protein